MRLLMIPSDNFSYRTTKRMRFAEPLSKEVPGYGDAANALVVFLASERGDEAQPDAIAEKAFREIISVRNLVKSARVVLYPLGALSEDLAPPVASLDIVRRLRARLGDAPGLWCPFGWHKQFTMKARGQTPGAIGRRVVVGAAEIEGARHGRGKGHPLSALSARVREIFLDSGLDEMLFPLFMSEGDVKNLGASEFGARMGDAVFAAEREKPPLKVDKQKEAAILQLVPDFTRFEELRHLVKDYNRGDVSVGELPGAISERLGLDAAQSEAFIDEVFTEFRKAKAIPREEFLRAEILPAWLPVLGRMYGKDAGPIRLFTIGPMFQLEKETGAPSERFTAAAVLSGEGFSEEDGQRFVSTLLRQIGMRKSGFRLKSRGRRWCAPGTEMEMTVPHHGQDAAIGELFFIEKSLLRKYGVGWPVFVVTFDISRMSMVLEGATDPKVVMYPQLFEPTTLTDGEIASRMKPLRRPRNEELRRACREMVKVAMQHREDAGPAEVSLYHGKLSGKELTISCFNWDEGKPLLSLAAMNEVVVHNGNVYGLPNNRAALGEKFHMIYDEGVWTGMKFLDAMVETFAADAESAVMLGEEGPLETQWKITKKPHQISILVPDEVYDFINARKKSIRLGGPLFFGLRAVWR